MVRTQIIISCLLVAACRPAGHGPRAYVSNENDGTVSVLDLHTGDAIAAIRVGKRPRGMQVVGNRLYVALSGSPKAGPGVDESTLPPPDRSADGIGVVDLDALVLLRTIESGQDPEAFALLDDDTAVVANEETGEASLVELGSRTITARIPVGGEPEGVGIAPDKTAWVTSEADGTVAVIDPATARLVAKITVGNRPRAVAFTPTHALVTGEGDASLTFIDLGSRTVAARLELPASPRSPARPMGIAIAPDGKRGYVTTGRAGTVVIVDLVSRSIEGVIDKVGLRPWGIAVGRDGTIYTANGPSNDVAVIDPATGQVVRRIETGASPWGVIAI